jgi:hypothetical protein
MQPFSLDSLLFPGMLIFFSTLAVSYHVTKMPATSIVVAFIKAGIFMVYFGVFFDGYYTFLDDWTYLERGVKIVDADIGLTNLNNEMTQAMLIVGSEHFAYYLHNAYAIRLFGEGYFAPVGLNIIVTVIIAYLGARLFASEFDLKSRVLKLFFIFLMLHPDILAWSNIMNGKDILVLLFHVILLMAVSMYLRGRILQAALIAFPVIVILFSLRFYVPIFFMIAFAGSRLSISNISRLSGKSVVLSALFVIGALSFLEVGIFDFGFLMNILREQAVNPLFGLVRFMLTPIPFGVTPGNEFLNIPALIHWLLFPCLLIGIKTLWSMRSKYTRFLILYLLVFLLLYSVYGELQGPRHRVQLDYIIAVLQFMGLLVVTKRLAPLFRARPQDMATIRNESLSGNRA